MVRTWCDSVSQWVDEIHAPSPEKTFMDEQTQAGTQASHHHQIIAEAAKRC
jgi:hypothetical protein